MSCMPEASEVSKLHIWHWSPVCGVWPGVSRPGCKQRSCAEHLECMQPWDALVSGGTVATYRACIRVAGGQGAGAASLSTEDSIAILAPLTEAAGLPAFGEARPAEDKQCRYCLHLPCMA